MQRRDFGKSVALVGLSLPLFGSKIAKTAPASLKAAPIAQGDKIALITPASALKEGQLEECRDRIKALGLKVTLGKNVGKKNGYLAGTDQERLEDLHNAFQNSDIKGIWCLRGGYGVGRLLPKLNYKMIQNNPKFLIGYSDITALHAAMHTQTGLVLFHGPVATSEHTPYTLEALQKTIFNPPTSLSFTSADSHECTKMNEGVAVGKLIGGNLSLLAALCGTPYLPSFKDKIVFIEDIGEAPYRIDRMLTQLLQANQLDQAAGIILGQFSDWKSKNYSPEDINLDEMLEMTLGHLKIPIIKGFSIGHVDDQITVPIGIHARLDTGTLSLEFLEKPFR